MWQGPPHGEVAEQGAACRGAPAATASASGTEMQAQSAPPLGLPVTLSARQRQSHPLRAFQGGHGGRVGGSVRKPLGAGTFRLGFEDESVFTGTQGSKGILGRSGVC